MSSIHYPLQPQMTEPTPTFSAFDVVMQGFAQPELGLVVGPALSAQAAMAVAALGLLAVPGLYRLFGRTG